MKILEARNISKTYSIGNRSIRVLDDVSFHVHSGEFVVIQGSSGSGKTTLLSLLSGLDQPSEGQVFLDGQEITHFSEDDLAPIRNKSIGFVFQSFHLIPSLTAGENILFPAELRKDGSAEKRALSMLARIGLEKRMHNFPHQLSGGEKQRLAICRALINDPKIVFADEPTGNLDAANGAAVLDMLLEMRREQGATLVLVTHSGEIAVRADRTVRLEDGRIRPETQ